MELQELKELWETEETPRRNRVEIRALLNANHHPVLRDVRRQVVIEVAAWVIFLLLAYSTFDADTKPVWTGLAIVVPVLVYLIHLLTGYSRIIASPVSGSLTESLVVSYRRMRRFAVNNLLLRSLVLAGMLLYFSYGITFTTAKYWTLGGISAFFIAQLLLNRNLWFHRLNRLGETIRSLEDRHRGVH